MQSVQAQIDALIAAPAGRALLVIAARSGLDPVGIVTPRNTLELAALALGEVSRWRIDRRAALSQLERADPHRLQSLARALLNSPGCSVVVRAAGTLEAGMAFARRGSSPCRTSRKPRRIAVVLGALCAEASQRVLHVDAHRRVKRRGTVGTSDFADTIQPSPIACWRLDAAPDARVFEVDGPGAWHVLCARYPALGEDGRIVPHWSAVASDFDAVHLTLGGLLTTEQVRIDSPSGWSQHDGWDFEQARWLHWKFTRAERLPDVL